MQESSSETSANHSAIVILKAASWQLPPIAACGKPLALRALYREVVLEAPCLQYYNVKSGQLPGQVKSGQVTVQVSPEV